VNVNVSDANELINLPEATRTDSEHLLIQRQYVYAISSVQKTDGTFYDENVNWRNT